MLQSTAAYGQLFTYERYIFSFAAFIANSALFIFDAVKFSLFHFHLPITH